MKHLHTFEHIDWSDVDLIELKYKKINSKMLSTLHPKIRMVVDKMLTYTPELRYDNCLLDVKVRNLVEGQCACALDQYHYDWVRTYDEPPIRHEMHLIYSNVNGTEFEGYKCIDNSIYTYGRELHRGSIQTSNIKRVLIRLSHVDDKKPKNSNKA